MLNSYCAVEGCACGGSPHCCGCGEIAVENGYCQDCGDFLDEINDEWDREEANSAEAWRDSQG